MRLFLIFFIFVFSVSTRYTWAESFLDDYQAGIEYYQLKQYDQAIIVLKEAVEIDPESWQAYQVLGSCYYRSGNLTEAVRAFQASLRLHSYNPTLKKFVTQLHSTSSNSAPGSASTPSGSTPASSSATMVVPAIPQSAELSPKKQVNAQNKNIPEANQEKKKPLSQDYFFIGAALGVDVPADNWQPAYTSAFGEEIALGYEVDQNVALMFDVENFNFSGNNYSGSVSDSELLFLPTVRYRFWGQGFSPYVSFGTGAEFEFLSASMGNTAVLNWDLAAGAGLQYQWGDRLGLFVEGKYNFVFSYDVTGQDIPLLFGANFGI